MKKYPRVLLLLLLVFAATAETQADPLPLAHEMYDLRPQPGSILQLYDGVVPRVASTADVAHQLYTNPAVLADLEMRLSRVRDSGLSEDVLSIEERQNFSKNFEQLRKLEKSFFERWYLKAPMNAAALFQRWWTVRNSPEPQGIEREALIFSLQEAVKNNPLYANWFQPLPREWGTATGPHTWGELLLQFSENTRFRKEWIRNHPESLSRLLEFSKIWAWEDSSVRAVTVYNSRTPLEHWVFHRYERVQVPNRFRMILEGDMDPLLRLEFAPTIFFNRLSRIGNNGTAVTYYLEAIEKGRTMEIAPSIDENGTSKKTFPGAELLRKSKADEFVQRDYVQRGSLNLFLGMRTLQLNQIQELFKTHPELVLAVGQFGFSVTGGRAQTVSNRTDTPEQQIRKLTATLIDIIEFANTKDVDAWFRNNTQHVLRTIVGGVGAGGTQALKEPNHQQSLRLMCRELF